MSKDYEKSLKTKEILSKKNTIFLKRYRIPQLNNHKIKNKRANSLISTKNYAAKIVRFY